MAERLGFLPPSFDTTGSGSLWFHAVSVGEVLSALEPILRIRAERPHLAIYLSTTTLAGRATAERRLSGLVQGIFFAPLDYHSIVRRVLRRLRPSAVIVLETEIWPNLYRESKLAGSSLIMLNARISDRALPRYRLFRAFFKHVLSQPDAILAQSEEDTRRFLLAGAPADRVLAAGNLKYDFTPPAAGVKEDLASFLDSLHPGAIWIAASTMPALESDDPDEDDAVIRAFQKLAAEFPSLLLILAPRRPERFDIAAEKLADAGVRFARRTALANIELPGALLLDSIGELAAVFERATVVFMGGTLASRGGHNILEPACFGKPIVAGPHMENFAAIADEFTAAGALSRIADTSELAPAVGELLRSPERASRLSEAARCVFTAKRGALDRMVVEILGACDAGIPNPLRTRAARTALTPLSWIWRAGHRVSMARALTRRRSLSTRVVSVGSLAMGGAGKSPIVAHLEELLDGDGRNVAILTRGYARKSKAEVVVPKGDTAPVEETGDEAQAFIRAGHAHVGIGSDRFRIGLQVEKQLAPDIFLLDDGFQHARLKRDQDLVMIDALDPLGGGVFPLGRLREPVSSLSRATAVIVTRAEPGQSIAGIERLIRRYNPKAPIFTSRVVVRAILPAPGFPPGPIEGNAAAFCGLGQPRAFWRTLESLRLEVAFRQAFGDHHRYSAPDLRRLAARASAAGVETLLTTEKDMMNLPRGAAEILKPHRLMWVQIGVEIDNQGELLRRLL
ncbi:MAG TPA: tetraacyldisaccharide 4'-kinase [Bryobacteraceae bacterium]